MFAGENFWEFRELQAICENIMRKCRIFVNFSPANISLYIA